MKKHSWQTARFRRVTTAAVLAFATLAVASCDESTGPGAVTGVEVALLPIGTSDTNLVRGTADLRLIAAPHDANDQFSDVAVTWSTSDAAKATVVAVAPSASLSGGHEALVTIGTGAAAGGDVTITATAANGATGTYVFNVQHPATAVTVGPSGQSIRQEGVVTLTATVTDASGAPALGRTVNWTSGNTGTATVTASSVTDATGKATATVTGVADGVVTITATAENNEVADVSGSVDVTVAGVPLVASVRVRPSFPVLLTPGSTIQLTHTAHAGSGALIPGIAATWESGDEDVATVSATGLVTYVGEGAVNIAATVDNGIGTDVTGTSRVVVMSEPVTMLTSGVATAVGTIASGDEKLFAITVPEGATSLTITTSAGSGGDADVYLLLLGELPPDHNPDPNFFAYPTAARIALSASAGNAESIVRSGTTAPAAGTYIFSIQAWGGDVDVTGVNVTATVVVP